MTNIRTRGFKSRDELQEHLEDFNAAPIVADQDAEDVSNLQREAAWLKKEIDELQQMLSITRGETRNKSQGFPIIRYAITAAAVGVVLIAPVALRKMIKDGVTWR